MKRLREILSRMKEIKEELRSLEDEETRASEENPLPDDHAERVKALGDEWDALEEERAPLQEEEERKARIRSSEISEPGFAPPNYNRDEDPFDLSTLSAATPAAELRSRAVTAVEEIEGDFASDDHKETLTEKIEGAPGRDGRRVWDSRGVIPGMVLRMGSTAYHTAFAKAMMGHDRFWTDDERLAMQLANEFRAHMSLTDAEGGFGVPVTLDPSLIMTDDGSANPYRQFARVVTITNDEWRGLTSAGVSASYAAEGAEAGDNSPTRGGPTIKAEKAHAFVGASIELTMDYAGLVEDLRMEFQDAKDDLEAEKFTTGSGTDEPIGIVTALDGTSSEIAPSTAETFAFDDVEDLYAELPPKARSAAARVGYLVTNGLVILSKQQLRGENSAEGIWTNPAEGQPGRIHGVVYFEASALDDPRDIDPAVTADNFVAVVGDGRKFIVVDRVGLTVEFIPHLFATANNRPSGERGWYAFWRSGSDSVADGHFRMLSIPTTL